MTDVKIKHPRNNRLCFHELPRLQDAMVATHSPTQFNCFKVLARRLARPLDLSKPHLKQDSTAWAKFVAGMLAADPELHRYEGHWPIYFYFNSYTRRKWPPVRQPGGQDLSLHDNEQVTIQTIRISSPIKSTGVLKFPNTAQTRNEHQTLKNNDAQAIEIVTDRLPEAIYGAPPVANLPEKSQLRCVDDGGEAESLTPNNKNDQIMIQTQPHLQHSAAFDFTPETEVSTHIITSCIQCDASTIAGARYNARLRAFVEGDEKLLTAFANIGVRFDQHLDLLMRMKKTTLEMFFLEHIPASRFDVCMKWRLLLLLGNGERDASTIDTTSLATTGTPIEIDSTPGGTLVEDDVEVPEELTYISPPTLEDEVTIINYGYFEFRVNLQSAMQLEGDDNDSLFGDLLDAMVGNVSRYFRESNPDEALLRKVVSKVCSTCPGQFEKYENYWPIKVYLRWFRKNVPVIRPKYSEVQETNVCADVFSKNILRSLFCTAAWTSVDTTRRSQTPPLLGSSFMPLSVPTSRPIKQLPCPMARHRAKHPAIDINLACPTIHAYMHQQNLGELIPVLVHLGMHSEAHFVLLRQVMSFSSSTPPASASSASSSSSLLSLDATDRNTVLNSPKLNELGELQKFLLGIAFDIDEGVIHFIPSS